MNTMKISLFVFAVLSMGYVNAQCPCGLPSPLPLPLPVPPPPSCVPLPPVTLPPSPPSCSAPAPPAPIPLPPSSPCGCSPPVVLPPVLPPVSPPVLPPLPCGPLPTTTPKPKVFINKQQPIIINRPAQSYVVNAGSPVLIKPAPVVIQRAGKNEIRPVVETITSKPIVVNKKIIKIDRPIVKKYYQETFSQTEQNKDCGSTIALPPVLPPAPAPLPSPLPCSVPLPSPMPCQQTQQQISDAEIQALLNGLSPLQPQPPVVKPCGCA